MNVCMWLSIIMCMKLHASKQTVLDVHWLQTGVQTLTNVFVTGLSFAFQVHNPYHLEIYYQTTLQQVQRRQVQVCSTASERNFT